MLGDIRNYKRRNYMKLYKKLIGILILFVLLIGNYCVVYAGNYSAIATMSRSQEIPGCVQNFDVFKFSSGTAYMMTSRSANEIIHLELGKLNKSTGEFEKVGKRVKTISGHEIPGHGDSVEVLEHEGEYYYVYVNGQGKEINSIGCSKLNLTLDSEGEISEWELTDSTTTYLSLFPTYNSAPISNCLIASSENYICIATAYGDTIKTDTERYHIYKKKEFITRLSEKNYNQSNFNDIRMGTGMFKTGSLGFNVSKTDTVIQSIELDEISNNPNTVIIFGAIDNRSTREEHQINRVYLHFTPADPLTAQDLSKNKCYYSQVTDLVDGDKTIPMNFTSTISNRFELEGLKKVYGLSNAGIQNGWYVSVNSTQYKNDIENPWNFNIYKATTTPVTNY